MVVAHFIIDQFNLVINMQSQIMQAILSSKAMRGWLVSTERKKEIEGCCAETADGKPFSCLENPMEFAINWLCPDTLQPPPNIM